MQERMKREREGGVREREKERERKGGEKMGEREEARQNEGAERATQHCGVSFTWAITFKLMYSVGPPAASASCLMPS